MARSRRPFRPFTEEPLPLTAVPSLPLPEAATLRTLGLPFSENELTHIRTAMAPHKASRQPQLTFDGWKCIGLALNFGEVRANQHAEGIVTSRGKYGQALSQFLRASGFIFINKGVRWALRQIIERLDEVESWREGLLANDRSHLNNPIDVWDRFCEDQRQPRGQQPQRPVTRQRRGHPSILEQAVALQEALEQSEAARDMLESTLFGLLKTMAPEALERLPDAMLREVFGKLPDTVQDARHDRLYPGGAGAE